MFSRQNRMIGTLYALADAVLALGSFWLAHAIRARLPGLRPLYPAYFYLWIVPVAVGIWMLVGLTSGIYNEIREEELRRAILGPLKVACISTTLLFAFTFALKLEYISRSLLGLYAMLDLVAMVAFRLVARSLAGRLRRAIAGLRHFLLIGNTPEAVQIAGLIEANEERGMRLCGFALAGLAGQAEQASPAGPAAQAGKARASETEPVTEASINQTRPSWQVGLRRPYLVYALEELREVLHRQVIDEVIFAVRRDDLEKLDEAFLVCEEEGVKRRLLVSFFPQGFSKIYFERLGELPLLTLSATPENEYLLLMKRALDFLMSVALLAGLSPVFLVLAVAIKLTSKGPVFYRQTRCGLGGRKFTVYKFRSMRADADLRREELEALNEMDGPVFKIANDPRCTAVGRFMRKFSLDELPQLFNILKGDMSFVGPRPPLPGEVEKYEPWQRRRLRMQPGLTCLWALEGRSRLNFRRWMELDLEYIDNWSPTLDWKILWKTIPVVLLGRGAS